MAIAFARAPLEHEDSIRLLKLEPPWSQDPQALHAALVQCRLSDKPEFEAISYAWGEPVFPEMLHFPTGSLKITSSLAAALQQFRRRDRSRWLWADAVCINQNDLQEKSAQVARMGTIFNSAQWVLAWLGTSDEESEYVMANLKNIAWTVRRCVAKSASFDLTDPSRSFDATFDKEGSLYDLIRVINFRKLVDF